MARILYLLLLFVTAAIAQSGVYKHVNPDGSVEFTDTPQAGDEPVALPKVQTYKAPRAGNFRRSLSSSTGTTKAPPGPKYTYFTIGKPAADETIRSNEGRVSIEVVLDPPLSSGAGHVIQISLDGKPLSNTFTSNTFSLTNVDRGTHSLSASVVDKAGTVLGTAASSVTFHMKQQSVLFPKTGGNKSN